jgi:hypothetical protein
MNQTRRLAGHLNAGATVGVHEIIALEEQRLTGCPRQRIGRSSH